MRLVGEDRPPTRHRYTVPEAAEILGLTVEAVRGRIKRKKLRSTKEDSTVYVYLDTDQIPTSQQPDEDQTAQPQPESTALVSEMRGRIEDLQQQLASERQAHAEARRIIAGLVERIPAIEAPASPEPPGESETGAAGPVEPTPSEPVRDQQEATERPWWRFWR
jgi:hypothetical protein